MSSVNVGLAGFLFEHGTLLVGSTLCVCLCVWLCEWERSGLALFSSAGG